MLGKLQVAEGAPIIAKRVADPFDRNVATEALIEMGPAAEKAVLAAFNHPDHNARERHAARVAIVQDKHRKNRRSVYCRSRLGGEQARQCRAAMVDEESN